MDLSEKAMLVTLSIKQWSGRVHDKKASKEVADNHGTTDDAGRYHKAAMAKEHLKNIQQAATAARTFHYENTLPWLDTGARILPSANYDTYEQKMAEFRQEFEAAFRDFLREYPSLVEEMRIRLNGLFNPKDYPDINSIGAKFDFGIEVTPMPNASDFRVKLRDSEVTRIQQRIAERSERAAQDAMADLWNRLYDAVSRMAESLPKFNPDEKKGKARGTFRDSLVDNLTALVDLLPRLNVTGNADLENMRQAVEEKLTANTAQALRDNQTAREETAAAARQIASDMAAFMGAE